MKKTYEQPEIEVIKFELNVALTALTNEGEGDADAGDELDFGLLMSSAN